MINRVIKWMYPDANVMPDTYGHAVYNDLLTNDGIYFYYNEYMYQHPNEIYEKDKDICPTIKLSTIDIFEADSFDDYSEYGFRKFGGRWFRTAD